MGQITSKVIEKTFESGEDTRLLYGATSMIGWRSNMEDTNACSPKLDEEKDNSNSFFAVYDGHTGDAVAKFASQNLHKRLINEESYREKQYETALKRAFIGTDEDILASPDSNLAQTKSGCAAIAALLTSEGEIYVANAGDARAILSVKGEVKPLSFDHKPDDKVEKTRITAAGGSVNWGRVNGRLALSRGLGDFEYKKNADLGPEDQITTANPDVLVHRTSDEDEFLVLASDGIWECMSSQAVINFVRRKLHDGKDLCEIGELLCDYCVYPEANYEEDVPVGSDNMTVLVVAILNGRTKEEWYSWIHERVESNYGYATPAKFPLLHGRTWTRPKPPADKTPKDSEGDHTKDD